MAGKRQKDRTTWWIYIVQCANGTFYTGMTTDLERRLHEHNNSTQGARYTRIRRPVTPVYQEGPMDRRAAMKREIAIKRLPRKRKAALAEGFMSL